MAVVITVAILLLTATFFAPMFAILANEHTQISGDPQLMIVFGCDNDGYEMSSAPDKTISTIKESFVLFYIFLAARF